MDGTPFGRYLLQELLGRGGMGEVWRAYDTATKRVVAIKLLPPHLADDDTFVRRFRREAEAAAGLNNPHIIPIHFYGEIDGRLYVDMRLVEGRDLQEVLAAGPLEPRRAVRIIEQVAKALHAAHKIGLVHRDVKPSNILLDEDDFAYLIDFGIARGADQTGLTATGGVIGTWFYMAPERLTARDVDARADIYALACVLYECLTGSRPFPGDSLESQVGAHLAEPPPQPSSTRTDVPQEFDAVVAKGMAKDPDDRYATTVELARDALDAITVPIPRPEPSPAPAPAAEPPPAPTVRQDAPTRPVPDDFASAPTHLAADITRPAEPLTERQATNARWWRRKAVLIPAAAALAVIAVVIAVTLVVSGNKSGPNPPPRQTTLPFTGIHVPKGVAVGKNGTVYVAEGYRVVTLATGATSQTVLSFTGLNTPWGVAADNNGTVYVADSLNSRVVTLAAGATSQTVLPFTLLNIPCGVAVDSNGTVYVADQDNHRVVTLAAGATSQTVLPFTGLSRPQDVAVDNNGTVYVADQDNHRVVTLAAGATSQTVLPFTGLSRPQSVAVDNNGTVYVADDLSRVVALAAG